MVMLEVVIFEGSFLKRCLSDNMGSETADSEAVGRMAEIKCSGDFPTCLVALEVRCYVYKLICTVVHGLLVQKMSSIPEQESAKYHVMQALPSQHGFCTELAKEIGVKSTQCVS